MIFGSYLVEDGDPDSRPATANSTPFSPYLRGSPACGYARSPTSVVERPLTSKSTPGGGYPPFWGGACAPGPAPLLCLPGSAPPQLDAPPVFPVVNMPRVTSTADIEFTLEMSGLGPAKAERERREALDAARLQAKLGLTDAQAAELDLTRAVRAEAKRLRRTRSLGAMRDDDDDDAASDASSINPFEKRRREMLAALPPVSPKARPATSRPRPLASSSKAPAKSAYYAPPRRRGRRRDRGEPDTLRGLRKQLAAARRAELSLNRELTHGVNRAVGVAGPSMLATGKYEAAARYVQSMGLDTLLKTVKRLSLMQLASGWNGWQDFVKASKRRDAEAAFVRKHAAAEVWRGIQDAFRGLLRKRWATWRSATKMLRTMEDREAAEAAAITMQRGTRGHMARQEMRRRRAIRIATRRRVSATRIQTRARRRAAFRRVAALRAARLLREAATMIQACARARLSRLRVKRERELEANRSAAVSLQNSWRSNKAWRLAQRVRKDQKQRRAATTIQTRQRGRAARSLARRKRRDNLEKAASTTVQALARAVFARERVDALYEKREAQLQREHDAACYLQTAWRARCARVAFGSKLRALMERRRAEHAGATAIQRRARGAAARANVDRLRDEAHDRAISVAKRCVETWDDETAAFYYYVRVPRGHHSLPPPSE